MMLPPVIVIVTNIASSDPAIIRCWSFNTLGIKMVSTINGVIESMGVDSGVCDY